MITELLNMSEWRTENYKSILTEHKEDKPMTKEEIIKDLKSEIKRRRALLITTKGEYAKMLHSDIADLIEEKIEIYEGGQEIG